MFVRNETSFECVLARGRLTDETAVLSVNFEVQPAVGNDGRLSLAEPRPRRESDPPDVREIPLWRGTSVTAAGTVYGPSRAPYRRTVTLAVDGTEHRVVVSGPRRWVRRRGGLEPSEPEPFDAVPLSWSLAFGGEYEQPPGICPDTGLPHPGGKVVYPLNPGGVGFYPDEEAAEGQPLPPIEREDAPVRCWSDRTVPGGLGPCRDLVGLRITAATSMERGPATNTSEGRAAAVASALDRALRVQHFAPGSLVFEWLGGDASVRLGGLGSDELVLGCPTIPLRVWVRRGQNAEALRGRLRSLHLCSDTRQAWATFSFAHRYVPRRPPHWIQVGCGGAG